MDKGVRKYSRGNLAARWIKYGIHRTVIRSIKLWVGFMFLLCLAATAGLAIIVLQAVFYPTIGKQEPTGEMTTAFLVAVSLVLGPCMYFSGKFIRECNQASKGSLLNPLSPKENSLLPDADLLVRPSSSSAAQPAELLRAATETAEVKPEELLRAGTER